MSPNQFSTLLINGLGVIAASAIAVGVFSALADWGTLV